MLQHICLLVIFLIISILITGNAFKSFPQIYSIDTDVPWVWDAVYDSHNALVSMVTIPSSACRFDRAQWLSLVSMFPQYSNQLADGNTSNILIQTTSSKNKESMSMSLYNNLYCHYYYDKKWVGCSEVFHSAFGNHRKFSSILIKCNAHNIDTWNEVQLSHSSMIIPYKLDSAFNVYQLTTIDNRYNLTVCTATMNANRSYLVEWIEYHILQGFEHFYMYDMSVDKTSPDQLLSAVLSDYITQGLVSVVHWPYENCVRGMASGRTVHYYTPDQTPGTDNGNFFIPPRAIAQTAALSSCYQRFKHTTKYMAHIDDDEFLHINNDKNEKLRTVRSFAESIFDRHLRTPAISFLPIKMSYCPNYQDVNSINQRVGVWKPVRFMDNYESKMIMRTAAVEDFFVHYITSVHSNYSTRNKYVPTRATASLLHYKSEYPASNSIWGHTLPLQYHPTRNCHNNNINKILKFVSVNKVIRHELRTKIASRLIGY